MNQPVSKPSDEPSMEEILASIRKIISEDDVNENPSDAAVALKEKLLEADSVVSKNAAARSASLGSMGEDAVDTFAGSPSSDDDILELTEPVDENGDPIDAAPQIESVEEVIEAEEAPEIEEVTLPPQTQTEVVIENNAPEVIEEDAFFAESEETGFDAILEEETEEKDTHEETIEREIDLRAPLISETALQDAAAALNLLSQMAKNPTATPEEPEMDGDYAKQTVEELVKSILKPLLKEWLDANLPSLVKWIVAEQIEIIVQKSAGYDASSKDDAKNHTQKM